MKYKCGVQGTDTAVRSYSISHKKLNKQQSEARRKRGGSMDNLIDSIETSKTSSFLIFTKLTKIFSPQLRRWPKYLKIQRKNALLSRICHSAPWRPKMIKKKWKSPAFKVLPRVIFALSRLHVIRFYIEMLTLPAAPSHAKHIFWLFLYSIFRFLEFNKLVNIFPVSIIVLLLSAPAPPQNPDG